MTTTQDDRFSAVIVAGGKGTRFGGYKQLLKIDGKTIVEIVLDRFFKCGASELVLVIREELIPHFDFLKKLYPIPLKIVIGGDKRGDSVYNGVKVSSYNYVLIHDAVRPNVTCELIQAVKKALSVYDAVVPILPLRDTVVKVEKNRILEKVDRESLKLVQTPQGFKKEVLLNAFDIARRKEMYFTDESTMLKEVMGISSYVVDGDFQNVKITYMEDVYMLRQPITTMGYDIHRLKEGGRLKIGGEVVKEGIQAVAHSDGDVVLHALIDALLSIKGEKDIGTLFPDTDDKWKNADSTYLLSRTLEYLGSIDILKVDITCILEKIKLMPFRDKIRENIATYLNIPKERVSFKAKTKEGIDEVGKGKAVEAFCVITYLNPICVDI